MKKPKNSQSGFGTAELIAVVIVLAALSAVGWVVYKHQKKSATHETATITTGHTTKGTTKPPAKTTDPTSNWKRVGSNGGAYSIKVPDGWELTNYPGNTLNGDSITFAEGKPAVITTGTAAYAGDQKRFNVSLLDKQYTAPQWQSPNPYGTEATEDFSIGSINGKRYSIEYTQTVTGVTRGDKVYQYVFNLPNGKELNVVYIQHAGDADNLKTVEQAVHTIIING